MAGSLNVLLKSGRYPYWIVGFVLKNIYFFNKYLLHKTVTLALTGVHHFNITLYFRCLLF